MGWARLTLMRVGGARGARGAATRQASSGADNEQNGQMLEVKAIRAG